MEMVQEKRCERAKISLNLGQKNTINTSSRKRSVVDAIAVTYVLGVRFEDEVVQWRLTAASDDRDIMKIDPYDFDAPATS